MFIILFPLFALLVFILYINVHSINYKIFRNNTKSIFKKSQSNSPKEEKIDGNSEKSKLSQLDLDKELYHKLQNLEYYPEALLCGYNRLLSLFDSVLDNALSSSSTNILNAIPTFSQEKLKEYLDNEFNNVGRGYKEYLKRRQNGGPRELFPDFSYATYWLRTAAPVKYVDGAWLGGLHRCTTDRTVRPFTKIAWQILSEELGDGDIEKNHVWLYRKLLKSVNADYIGSGDSKEFISSTHNINNDVRVWTASLAQLCISLFPELFLPEILGFNMSYETLPLHLLITIYELRELNIDPYYFVLHVSIDNKHSGHAAMGMKAVIDYIQSFPQNQQHTIWKRIQVGFLLASELATTPQPQSQFDRDLEKVFADKTDAAHSIHSACPAKIGGRYGKKLTDWLNPNVYPNHSLAFLRALADSRWVVRGQPEKSLLVSETKWPGRMFGAFTINEVQIIEQWIKHLTHSNQPIKRTKTYETFIGQQISLPNIDLIQNLNQIINRPSAPRNKQINFETLVLSSTSSPENKIDAILSLLSVSSVPFEYIPSLPAKCATSYGMMAIKCLRALYGFLPESDVCPGMDEVTNNIPIRGVVEIARIHLNDINEFVRDFVEKLFCLSVYPEQNESILIGLQYGFIQYVFQACQQLQALSTVELKKLEEIQTRCRNAMDLYLNEKNPNAKWLEQMNIGKKALQTIVSNILD